MKKDINKNAFLGKWLSGDLSNEECKSFEESEDYLAYKDILKGVERLDRPIFDIEKRLAAQKIYNLSYKETKTSKVIKRSTWLYSVAATVLVIIGIITLFFQDVTIRTEIAQTKVITLPDHSVVTLNADSSLKYDKYSFLENRVLQLKGEAFFDVQEGSTFTVNTKNDEITVLGTEFNVYSRDLLLEVHCFEGKVRVKNNIDEVTLIQGKGVKSNEKEHLSVFDITHLTPDWLHGKSSFYEVPLEQLIKELQRQYNIKIHIGNVDIKRVFTGFFNHNNLETALRTSFEPMNINYKFENKNNISLKNK